MKHVLVESYRTEKGPRQRVVMQLGTLTLPKSEWKKLAAALEGRLAGQITLFEDESQIAEATEQVMTHFSFTQQKTHAKKERQEKGTFVPVDLESITTAQSRSLGPELVGHAFWEKLEFNHLLSACDFTPTQQALAEAVIVGRLVAPSSDLASWRWLRERTALIELLPVNLESIGKDAIYEIADQLLANKKEIEHVLRDKEVSLFPRQNQVFLFDLTNTYFEGSALNNELAMRGKSKEKRSDCPLVTLALVVDDAGFPIFSQIYGGNQSEPETLTDILEQLTIESSHTLLKGQRPMIVMDRGIATKDNLLLIKEMDYPYIVIERRAVEKEYVQEFQEARETFEKISSSKGETQGLSSGSTVTESVFVKKISIEKGSRILCLSEGREKKEIAMDTLKETRFLNDLDRLKSSVEKGNVQLVEKVGERVGRLRERYPSIARHYTVSFELDEKEEKVKTITFDKKPTRTERAILTGCYVIETSEGELSAEEVWRLYTTLTKIEAAFRSLKTDLGVRPVYHQLAERTRGHLFISVLAYHLLISIEYQLKGKGDHRNWSTIKDQLSTHQRTTVIVTDQKDQIHHIRVSGTPEKNHNEIYKLLGVKDPLKRKHEIVGQRL
ncbi:IS1634 family transposase [Paenisporosarcina sp. TG20]|uniref:IS1634 family transposase n=1 Tax=Paenisporosarcina sp. TG20 TaxID=1211706 RepID=UPI000375557E|nr:IS1634 family transposase [Paenisporosarcina sp. TG20]